MKNNIFISKVTLKISGHNIERFIKRLKDNNIEVLNLKYIDKDIIIKIYKKDYKKLLNIKTIYDIKILNYSGFFNMKNKILNNKFIIISVLIGLIFLYIITNLIFSIDIITNDNSMKIKLIEELKNNGISKYKLKKGYNQLQYIKTKILSKYKNEIEWIEIEVIGTKYIIRYEPRVIYNEEQELNYRDIIASKDAVIKDMYVESGQIVKNKNTYVKKGDVIVSGYISLNNNVKDVVVSKGKIYGECWYNITVNYPFKYYEEQETGNKKNILVLNIFNREIELFNFNKYKNKKIKNKTILKNNLFPIKLIYQSQKEINVINENNNKKQVVEKAIKYSKEKIENKLKDNEYINDYKILSKEVYSDYIKLNIFYSVIEDITEYKDIENLDLKTDN